MPEVLTPEQVDEFRQRGHLSRVRVMSADDAATLLAELETYEERTGGPISGSVRHKTHLLFASLGRLIASRPIVDAVADLYGPDLLCWSTSFFVKEPHDPAFVSWHQDATYWGLSRPDVVTAWVALTPSTEANGALQVIPGTHLVDQLPHRDTFDPRNLLSRGQEIAVDVDEDQAVTLELQPGEMSLHHVRLVHGSAPNTSDTRRVGFAIRYLPPSVSQIGGGRDSATLVRGVDHHHHFEDEPVAEADFQPELVAMHRRLTEQQASILFAGTGRTSFDDRTIER